MLLARLFSATLLTCSSSSLMLIVWLFLKSVSNWTIAWSHTPLLVFLKMSDLKDDKQFLIYCLILTILFPTSKIAGILEHFNKSNILQKLGIALHIRLSGKLMVWTSPASLMKLHVLFSKSVICLIFHYSPTQQNFNHV